MRLFSLCLDIVTKLQFRLFPFLLSPVNKVDLFILILMLIFNVGFTQPLALHFPGLLISFCIRHHALFFFKTN